MKLSTNSRYGLRAMVDLIALYKGVPVALSDIAERQQISGSYLEHTFSMLRKADYVFSARGNQGGYIPSTGVEEKRVGDLLRILEGNLSIIDSGPTYTGPDPMKRCLRENVWDVVNQRMALVVDSTLLSDLAEEMRMRGSALE